MSTLRKNRLGGTTTTAPNTAEMHRLGPSFQAIQVAGGNGPGDSLRCLNRPRGPFVTPDESVYVSDAGNHRIVKWAAGATAGLTVAGGYGPGNGLHQLDFPYAVGLRRSVRVQGGARWGTATRLAVAPSTPRVR
jgi:hypothetical protein